MSILNSKHQDSHIRSFIKSFTWRIVSTFMTGTIAFFVSGEIRIALMIGGIEFFVKLLVYYLHERAWTHIY